MMKSSMADSVANHRTRSAGLEKAAWAAKIIFLTVGIASTAVLMVRFAFPYLLTILSSSLPELLDHLISWFAPPYLFITVHFIIMVIWKLHGHQGSDDVDDGLAHVTAETPAEMLILESHPAEPEPDNEESTEPPRPEDGREGIKEENIEMEEDMDYSVTSCPDGIDATWRAIMDGKSSSPVNKQLRKSDTWERTSRAQPTPLPPSPNTLTRAAAVDSRDFRKSGAFRDHVKTSSYGDGGASSGSVGRAKKEMSKSKTFRESTGAASSNAGWRGRDVLVVGRDELSGKVEAFIKMNYDQMRLQRREAEKQLYVGMVNAAY